jgi:hypothetical protein
MPWRFLKFVSQRRAYKALRHLKLRDQRKLLGLLSQHDTVTAAPRVSCPGTTGTARAPAWDSRLLRFVSLWPLALASCSILAAVSGFSHAHSVDELTSRSNLALTAIYHLASCQGTCASALRRTTSAVPSMPGAWALCRHAALIGQIKQYSIERQQRPFVKLCEIIRYNAQRIRYIESLYGRRSVPVRAFVIS